MDIFEIEVDENHIRGLVRAIIEQYETGLYEHGSQQIAIELAQDITVQKFRDNAEMVDDAIEELIDHEGTMH